MASDLTARLGGARSSLAFKAPCRVRTTANITLSGLQTIDTVAVVAEDRVLVMDQTNQAENGIYIVKTTRWERAKDFNGTGDAVRGTRVYVHSGSAEAKGEYLLTTSDPIVIGSSNIVWEMATLFGGGGDTVSGGGGGDTVGGGSYTSPTTTEGDIIVRGASEDARLGVGLEEYALISDGTNPVWTGFTQSGTDAVTRGWLTRLRETGYYSVKDFGAVGDGVADDLAAINLAIAACPATGGIVFFPPGIYRISATLNIGKGSASALATRQNITLLGASFSGTQNLTEINSAAGTAARGPSTILFDGTTGDTAVDTGGPGVMHMESLVINCNAKAGIGLQVTHNWNSTFKNITIVGWRTTGMYLFSYGNAATTSGMVSIGCMDNNFEKIRIAKVATTSSHQALMVGVDVDDATYGYPGVDVARCRFTDCSFTCWNDATCSSVVLRFCDLNTFENCFLYSEFTGSGSPAVSVPIRMLSGTIAPPASNSFPSGNVFNNCAATGAATTVIDSDWRSSQTNNGNLWFFPHIDETGSSPAWPVNPVYGGIFGFSQSGHWLAPQMGVRLGNLIDGVTRSVLWRSMTTFAITNTTTKTTILTRQIPAYLLQSYLCTSYGVHANDRQVRVTIKGRYFNNTGSSQNLTIQGQYGSTIFMNSVIPITSQTESRAGMIEASLTARGNSAVQQWGDFTILIGSPTGTNGAGVVAAATYMGQHSAIAERSTLPLSLTFSVQHSVAPANCFFTMDTGTFELL